MSAAKLGVTSGSLLCAALAAGCYSVPPYEPEEAVYYEEVGTGGTASGPGFALRFADGAGFHFPDALLIDGVDVLGHDTGQSCFDQDGVGFVIAPSPRISASGGATVVTNLLAAVLRGPAIVQTKLDWATRLACNSARNPGGTSTFTVFPDGRIVRFDTLVDPSSSEISASTCACDPAGVDFTVSTFWTLARSQFTDLYRPDMPGKFPLPVKNGEVIGNTDSSCVDDGARQVAFAWRKSIGTTIRGGDQSVAFGFDFFIGASVLQDFSLSYSSAAFIGRRGCEAAFARVEEHLRPSKLTINSVSTEPSERDGIYGGDTGSGALGIDLPSDRAEITGTTKSAYAVWVRFSRSAGAVRATRTGATGPWYLPQRVDERSWIIWFRDPLQTGQTVTIERR
jgi:hypothetical protein